MKNITQDIKNEINKNLQRRFNNENEVTKINHSFYIRLTSIICSTILGIISLIGLFFGKESIIGLGIFVGIVLFIFITTYIQ